MLVEAWCSSRPTETQLSTAVDIGLDGLHVMVNDHSTARATRRFTTAPESRLVETAQKIRDRGLSVHLTTWCMPHRKYLDELLDTMNGLAEKCDASSVMLDAEEPWTHARYPRAPYDEAAQMVAEGFACRTWGVTGIGYASVRKVGPLAQLADYSVPQVYCTSGNTLNPRTAPERFDVRWREKMGADHVDIGLAAYRQRGRPGWEKGAFMKAARESAERTRAERVIYWSLRWIAGYKSTSDVLRLLSRPRC